MIWTSSGYEPSAAGRIGRLALALTLVLPLPLSPATITVGGECGLPEAITAANDDLATGGCSAGEGSDTLKLTADVVLAAVDNGENGLPQVSSSIRVDGGGFTIARDPEAAPFRLFEVLSGGSLRLDDVTLTTGSVSGNGGAILNRGELHLEGASVLSSDALFGGGISNARATSSATLVGSTLSGNSAVAYGGGIYSASGSITNVAYSTISDNYAGWAGGGLFGYEGVVIEGSTISGNSTTGGGGGVGLVYTSFATSVSNSVLSNNTASVGGGINAFETWIDLLNVTLSGNLGGGLRTYDSFGVLPVELRNVTVAGNSPYGLDLRGFGSTVSVIDSIVAYSSGAACSGYPPVDGGGNFDDDGSCLGASPISGLDPVLADNGGPTQTHALLPGSSAIDVTAGCASLADQRGLGRDPLCDSGAFELDGAPAVGGAADALLGLVARCSNLTAGGTVTIEDRSSWNCRVAGLAVDSGDRIRLRVRGQPIRAGFGGSATGISSGRVRCSNLTTGQNLQFSVGGDPSWDCRAQGLQFGREDEISWTLTADAL